MNDISDKIKSGARTFLLTEYKYLTIFVLLVSLLLILVFTINPTDSKTDGIKYALCFAGGALLSALAGWKGMQVATDANVKTTQAAATDGLSQALSVSFTGGSVLGFTVAGLGLGGLSLGLFLVSLGHNGTHPETFVYAADALAGFGFGASSIALFARVAGGIYTKAADVGADLVGKVEMEIPEDDVRNPAVIADNVGDNVGDVAGMGADLFESYVSLCSSSVRSCLNAHFASFRWAP